MYPVSESYIQRESKINARSRTLTREDPPEKELQTKRRRKDTTLARMSVDRFTASMGKHLEHTDIDGLLRNLGNLTLQEPHYVK